MKKKTKIILLSLGIMLVTSILISISYAYYIFSVSQSGSNVVRTDCFEITYTDGNAINISNTIPLTDKEARELDPYTFTIKNICNQAVDYNVNIETISGSTMDLDAIATKLDSRKKQILGQLDDNESIVNNNAISSKTIYSNILKAGEEKTYNLRMWVDDSATVEQSASKSFSSKIVVSGVLHPNYKEAVLISGKEFNKKLRILSEGPYYNEDYSNTNITSFIWSETPPLESDAAVNVADSSSDEDIYLWFKDGTIYIYCALDTIYMSSDSSEMFYGIVGIQSLDISHFDTSNVTNMSSMFAGASKLTSLDVSGFDTSNVTNMSCMFCMYFDYKGKIENIDVSHFDTSNVTDMSSMFTGMKSLSSLDLSSFDTSKVTNMSSMFKGMSELTSIDLSNIDTSNVINMSNMFSGMSGLTSIDLSNIDTSKVTNMSSMFNGMSGLTSIDLSNIDTSNVINMSNMFGNMSNLTNIDLSNFDTSKVTNMSEMFGNMSNLTSIDLSNFDTSKVTNMSKMFNNMSKLTSLNLSNFDTSNVTDMSYMFWKLSNLSELNISSFNTSKVTNMAGMFSNVSSLSSLDLSNFDTSNVISMLCMFYGMGMLSSLNVTSFNTSNVVSMAAMFYGCISLSQLDISSFDTASLKYVQTTATCGPACNMTLTSGMFSTLSNLKTIYVGPNWNLDSTVASQELFKSSNKLVGGAGTKYSDNHKDGEYARVDDPANGKPGYFTLKTT